MSDTAPRSPEERRRCWPTRAAKRGKHYGPSARDRHEHRYGMSKVGLVPTTFAEVPVSPVVMRELWPLAGGRGIEVGAAGVSHQRHSR